MYRICLPISIKTDCRYEHVKQKRPVQNHICNWGRYKSRGGSLALNLFVLPPNRICITTQFVLLTQCVFVLPPNRICITTQFVLPPNRICITTQSYLYYHPMCITQIELFVLLSIVVVLCLCVC